MSHRRVVQREFARQADAFSKATALAESDLDRRVREALGEACSGRVLDLACGPGIVACALAADAREVVGLDLTTEMLVRARERARVGGHPHVRVLRGFAESLPFADASFDGAVLRLAVHHFERPGAVLRELRRVTRGDGRVAVLDLLTSPDPEVAELHNALERLRDPSHVRTLSRDELLATVRDAGFEIVHEVDFETPRDFDEWARIVSDRVRTDALRVVMRRLARARVEVGIGLQAEGDRLGFTYRWAVVGARPAQPGSRGAGPVSPSHPSR